MVHLWSVPKYQPTDLDPEQLSTLFAGLFDRRRQASCDFVGDLLGALLAFESADRHRQSTHRQTRWGNSSRSGEQSSPFALVDNAQGAHCLEYARVAVERMGLEQGRFWSSAAAELISRQVPTLIDVLYDAGVINPRPHRIEDALFALIEMAGNGDEDLLRVFLAESIDELEQARSTTQLEAADQTPLWKLVGITTLLAATVRLAGIKVVTGGRGDDITTLMHHAGLTVVALSKKV